MIDYKTVISTTEHKQTLMQWLRTVEGLLKKDTLTTVQAIRVTPNIVKLRFNFNDNSYIDSEEFSVSGEGGGSTVETNDGTNGSNILGITIDGKRYSFQNYKTDAGDLLALIQGSDTVTIDLAEDGKHIEVHLDEMFKNTLVTRSELNKPIDLPAGTNLLTYNWDAYTNGTWFKGVNLAGMPEGTKGEFLVQLIKNRNTRFAIYLYNTDIYENNTGNYINYHYADKFEGWQKIQTDLNPLFIKKFTTVYDKDIPEIAYGRENGISLHDEIVANKLASAIRNYRFLIIVDSDKGIHIAHYNKRDSYNAVYIFEFSNNLVNGFENQASSYFNLNTFTLVGDKLTFATHREWNLSNEGAVYKGNASLSTKIIKILGGELYD